MTKVKEAKAISSELSTIETILEHTDQQPLHKHLNYNEDMIHKISNDQVFL